MNFDLTIPTVSAQERTQTLTLPIMLTTSVTPAPVGPLPASGIKHILSDSDPRRLTVRRQILWPLPHCDGRVSGPGFFTFSNRARLNVVSCPHSYGGLPTSVTWLTNNTSGQTKRAISCKPIRDSSSQERRY